MDDPNMHAYEDQYMDTTDLILRSVCETDPADPDLKDTVCIGISDLKAILDLHLCDTSKSEAEPAQDAVDAEHADLQCIGYIEQYGLLIMDKPTWKATTPVYIRAAISAKKGGAA